MKIKYSHNQKIKSVFITPFLVFFILMFASCKKQEKVQKPNFVVIFIDDMGYGDIEPFGSTRNSTPHLNEMANQGMKLTSFYVSASVSTPARAGLITGCYPKRVGLATGTTFKVLFPGDRQGLNPQETTIAEVLQKAGYTTGCFGKWHLGDQSEFMPGNHGFDEYYGIPYSNDMWPKHPAEKWDFPPLPVLHNGEVVDTVKNMHNQSMLAKQFTDKAVDFIRENKENSFLVYLPHAYVHHPRGVRKEFLKKTKKQGDSPIEDLDWQKVVTEPWSAWLDWRTRAQISEVDWSVGRILNTLQELGLDENTLVIFTSDNGGSSGCSIGPLRGGKGTAWEGGFRVPTIACWPGHIPSDTVCDEVMSAMDLLPTFAGLADAKLPQDRIIDGKDVSSLLLGKKNAQSPHEAFFYFQKKDLRAVRSGKWKMFEDGRLYNLRKDIGETKDISQSHPEVVKRLTNYLKKARKDLGDKDEGGKNCRPPGIVENPEPILPGKEKKVDQLNK